MSYSLVRCLGCLLEPPIAGVTATGVNWCIWSPDDCIVIGARGVILSKAPGRPRYIRIVCMYVSGYLGSGMFGRMTATVPERFVYTLDVPERALSLAGY